MIISGKPYRELIINATDGQYDFITAKIDADLSVMPDIDNIILRDTVGYAGDFVFKYRTNGHYPPIHFDADNFLTTNGHGMFATPDCDWGTYIPSITGCGTVSLMSMTFAGVTIGYLEAPAILMYGGNNSGTGSLTSDQVDALLAACVASENLGGSGYVDWSGGTNGEPSAAGWANYDTLTGWGWTVQVNGSHP